ncbi:hypothetical protein M011DRAFT_466167 [Sporormia fimetaria CBS 119925]|uniref:Uncharacterized protein n=1 Tax=Sporormia fimetaria CBS 119925 TaxID=1340428 RepID=A0A6A6VFP4_9PLEO|nr:hypothetical protein M011DRAFT_466167 [Sporormia fimetaria CBS 119925]
MFFPFPYVGSHYEEYIVQHHLPSAAPWGMMGMPGPWGGPVPSHYAPPYGPHFGLGYGGYMDGYPPGFIPPMMGYGGGYGFRDGWGIQRGDWAGPYCGGTEGQFPN